MTGATRSSEADVTAFTASLGFELDPFQEKAIGALVAGRSVLVAAPTGAGKTVVGEFACHDALERGGRAFYTTPIKALSNQKYRDLVTRYGAQRVGLLTGDRSVNGSAPVVVMTTEVLRNMIYEASPALRSLRHVVLDEVHYLADRSRGAVWEEVIIQVAASVQLTALSATVSNAEDFGRWLAEVRDDCEVVIEEARPVPLKHHYFVNDRIHDTFRAGQKGGASREHRERASQALAGVPNPDVLMLERRARQRNRVTSKGRRLSSGVRMRWPSRPHVVAELAERGWLPAIVFVFSRNGCEKAVEQLVRAGVRLTGPEEREEIAALVDTMLADIPADDLRVLGFGSWRAGLVDGIAAHHAGMVPAFKEVVELLFQRGLLKIVVATETLALGINMPAKTVVIERLEKWNGESHVLLTPGEYTQLTGRAGRRGIDTVGHAVVLYQRDLDFKAVAGLVGTRAYPLRSSFAPSYNMAVNLLRHHDLPQAEALLGASFAQFEADSSVTRKADRLLELENGIRGYSRHLDCEYGDWGEYWAIATELQRLRDAEAERQRRDSQSAVREAIARLEPGDVLHLPWVGRRGLAAVVGIHLSKGGTPLAQVVTDERALTRVGPRELATPPARLDRIRLPTSGNPRQKEFRKQVGHALRGVMPPDPTSEPVATAATAEAPAEDSERIRDLTAQVHAHPCHGCPDRSEHVRWQQRVDDHLEEISALRATIHRATGSLVRQLDRILTVLRELEYVDDEFRPTPDGLRLAGIYSEVDLLVAEAVRRGLLDDLSSAELAGMAALFLYEPRGGEPTLRPELPTARLHQATEDVLDLADELRDRERAAGVRPLRELDAGFVAAAWRWSSGADLDTSIGDLELTGGDFVRNVKQVADLVGQLAGVGGTLLAATARSAMDDLRRGIVEA